MSLIIITRLDLKKAIFSLFRQNLLYTNCPQSLLGALMIIQLPQILLEVFIEYIEYKFWYSHFFGRKLPLYSNIFLIPCLTLKKYLFIINVHVIHKIMLQIRFMLFGAQITQVVFSVHKLQIQVSFVIIYILRYLQNI